MEQNILKNILADQKLTLVEKIFYKLFFVSCSWY